MKSSWQRETKERERVRKRDSQILTWHRIIIHAQISYGQFLYHRRFFSRREQKNVLFLSSNYGNLTAFQGAKRFNVSKLNEAKTKTFRISYSLPA